MITKLLNEVNENIETLNNLVQDKEYFEKLDERIEKVNNYVQEQKKEIERLNNDIKRITKITNQKIKIINDVREKLLCYGETFDLKVHQEMQKELLEILEGDKE